MTIPQSLPQSVVVETVIRRLTERTLQAAAGIARRHGQLAHGAEAKVLAEYVAQDIERLTSALVDVAVTVGREVAGGAAPADTEGRGGGVDVGPHTPERDQKPKAQPEEEK